MLIIFISGDYLGREPSPFLHVRVDPEINESTKVPRVRPRYTGDPSFLDQQSRIRTPAGPCLRGRAAARSASATAPTLATSASKAQPDAHPRHPRLNPRASDQSGLWAPTATRPRPPRPCQQLLQLRQRLLQPRQRLLQPQQCDKDCRHWRHLHLVSAPPTAALVTPLRTRLFGHAHCGRHGLYHAPAPSTQLALTASPKALVTPPLGPHSFAQGPCDSAYRADCSNDLDSLGITSEDLNKASGSYTLISPTVSTPVMTGTTST